MFSRFKIVYKIIRLIISKFQVILNRVKHANANLTQFDSGVPDHKMTWTHEKIHLAETVDDSRMKFQRNSTTLSTSKSSEKFDLFKKLHELYNELSRDEASQINYVSINCRHIRSVVYYFLFLGIL